ncbi:hypothetical protein DPQ22_09110 [Candidatus Tokpelaia sp.]|nr:hypothetical protein DPQ22_09110 [Candidatus Tokpelaia sp.]
MCFFGKIRLFCLRFYLKLGFWPEPAALKAVKFEDQALMSHKNGQGHIKSRGRRRRSLILAVILLFAAIYSGFWYFMAGRVENNLIAYIGQAAVEGVDIRCGDLRKSGYPLRLAISCAGLSIDKESAVPGWAETNIILESGAAAKEGGGAVPGSGNAGALIFRSSYLTAGAPVYAPHWILAEMGAPALLKLPYSRVIEADWQKLQCEGDCAAGRPRNIDISAEKLVIGNLPFLPDKALLSADFLRFGSKKRDGGKLSFSLSFDDLSVPYLFSGAYIALPPADGSLDIICDKAGDFYAGLRQVLRRPDKTWLRGKSGEIRKLVLSFKNGGGLALSGPVAVTDNGRVNGKITISLTDSTALMRTARSVFPNQADNLESLFFVLNSMPKNKKGEPQLVLEIIDSHMRLGFLKLGKIPPL